MMQSGIQPNAEGATARRTFRIHSQKVCGDTALLVWRAESDRFEEIEGADSLVIVAGKIKLQTIHYGLRPEGSIKRATKQ